MSVRGAARRGLMPRLRWAGGLATASALGTLMAIGPPGPAASAAGGYNQMTGAGLTDSAVTVPWTHGLLNASNQPIASANADRSSSSPTSPYSFMYGDFRKLSVTVSQTRDITHQGITISWKGGLPSITGGTGPQANFLQLMECYGDSNAGPSPDDCEFGSTGLLAPGVPNPLIGQRIGKECLFGTPSVINPPPAADGTGPLAGCDPQEPLTGHVAPCPGDSCQPPGDFSVPFVPVDGTPVYQNDLSQQFSEFNSNEVQEAVTSPNGTGQLQFETLTGTQAPGLGCGAREGNGQPRGCWLVIVPRGEYEPNGFKINAASAGASGYIQSSPLSASNWAMRIQVHLNYAPVQTFCPIGTQERETVGTQVVSRAMQSWQLALNQGAHCTKIYGYSAVPEATSTQQLALRGSGVGIAFTTIPIGSEAARSGKHGGTLNLPPILYAPVAVSAVGLGFNINDGNGSVSTPVKLNPVLLAKAVTQVYRFDLPDYYPSTLGHPGPTWSLPNPTNMSNDLQFQKLNPEVLPFNSAGISLAPLLTEDHSALNQQIWQWIQANPTARTWLDTGRRDTANSVAADPDYVKLKLGSTASTDSFPRAYRGCLNLGTFQGPPPKPEKRCSLDLLPYTDNYDSAAAAVLTANNPTTGQWSDLARAPDGTTGWWQKNGAEPLGQIFIWGIADTPDLAGYGLIDAQLCNNAGKACVAPSVASVTTALNSAKRDRAGLLEVNPARPGKGGYPLVQVIYAAVPLDQSAAALNDYADLIAYAAGQGQTPGVAPGDLPPGYLPLPAGLRAQAEGIAALLHGIASPKPPRPSPTSPAPTSPGQPGSSAPPGSSPGAGSSVPPAGSSTPAGPLTSPPTAVLAGNKTPSQPVGGIRLVLITVVIAGAACAGAGTALRYARVPAWLRRMRP